MNLVKGVGPRHDDDVGPVALGEPFEFAHVHVNHRPDGQLAGQPLARSSSRLGSSRQLWSAVVRVVHSPVSMSQQGNPGNRYGYLSSLASIGRRHRSIHRRMP